MTEKCSIQIELLLIDIAAGIPELRFTIPELVSYAAKQQAEDENCEPN